VSRKHADKICNRPDASFEDLVLAAGLLTMVRQLTHVKLKISRTFAMLLLEIRKETLQKYFFSKYPITIDSSFLDSSVKKKRNFYTAYHKSTE